MFFIFMQRHNIVLSITMYWYYLVTGSFQSVLRLSFVGHFLTIT